MAAAALEEVTSQEISAYLDFLLAQAYPEDD